MCRHLRGWNSGVCGEWQTLVKEADNEPFVGNNTHNLKERGRKLAKKCKSATYSSRTIIWNEEVEEEFLRSWLEENFVTGSTRPGEREFSGVCPFTCIEPSHCSTLELFYLSGPFLLTFARRIEFCLPFLGEPPCNGRSYRLPSRGRI